MKPTTPTELLDEIRKLNDKFDKLQSDVCITKNVNNLLSNRLVDIEHQCLTNGQYCRKECLDVVGIPNEVKHETLEDSVIEIFDRLGYSTDTDRTEICHQVSKNNNTVIIQFKRRKDCQEVSN